MITKDLKILDEFCKGCGTCEGVCPQGAIRLHRQENGRYLPRREEELCRTCDLCYRSCPAWPFHQNGLSFKSLKSAPAHDLIGPFLHTYSGFSNDKEMRFLSSSGGITSSILASKLRTGEIDTALVVRLKGGNPFAEPEVLLVRKAEEIQSTLGSKYLPIPLNRAIKEIMSRGEIRRVGVVGLPCHLEGLSKAGSIFKELRDKIAFTLGLFCRHTKELGFTRILLSRLGVDISQLDSLSYRCSGWPGYVRALLTDGTERMSPYFDEGFVFLWLLQSFAPLSCMLCCDPTAEFADISVGDAWVDEFADEKSGISLAITRTQRGEALARQAMADDVISMQEISSEKVVKSQVRRALMRKKVNYRSKLAALKPSGYREIRDRYSDQELDRRGILALRQIMMARNFSSGRVFSFLFTHTPTAFFERLKKSAQRRMAAGKRLQER